MDILKIRDFTRINQFFMQLSHIMYQNGLIFGYFRQINLELFE